MMFMVDDPEDPLGLEMPKAICSVAYQKHSVELSWGYCNCCCNLDLCQWTPTAYFVQLRQEGDTFWVPLTFIDTDKYL